MEGMKKYVQILERPTRVVPPTMKAVSWHASLHTEYSDNEANMGGLTEVVFLVLLLCLSRALVVSTYGACMPAPRARSLTTLRHMVMWLSSVT